MKVLLQELGEGVQKRWKDKEDLALTEQQDVLGAHPFVASTSLGIVAATFSRLVEDFCKMAPQNELGARGLSLPL